MITMSTEVIDLILKRLDRLEDNIYKKFNNLESNFSNKINKVEKQQYLWKGALGFMGFILSIGIIKFLIDISS